MAASATLWPCGTRSTRPTPESSTVPAASPPSLATIATLSPAAIRIVCGRALLAFAAVAGTFDMVESLCLAVALTVPRRRRPYADHPPHFHCSRGRCLDCSCLGTGQVAVEADRLHRPVPGRRHDRHPGAPDR